MRDGSANENFIFGLAHIYHIITKMLSIRPGQWTEFINFCFRHRNIRRVAIGYARVMRYAYDAQLFHAYEINVSSIESPIR